MSNALETAAAASRTPENCPYRKEVRRDGSGGELASCGLAEELVGHGKPGLFEAERFRCEGCCRFPLPDARNFNPAFASLMYGITGRILKGGGSPSCSEEAARALRERAQGNLLRIELNRPDPGRTRIPYAGNCFYLGDPVGERECTSCRGSVRQKTFACQHEDHADVTIADCKRCHDYEVSLERGRLETWAVGITTAPRKRPTLGATVASVARAGWPEAVVFAEPGAGIPEEIAAHQITQRPRTMGAWPNFLLSLSELFLREPHADAYLMIQDDVLMMRGLRSYLERALWPAGRLGVVSLHTASHQDRGDVLGFFPADLGWSAWGAQAYVFSNASLRAFLRSPVVVNHRHRGPGHGKCNVDSVVGQWCRNSGLAYYLHTPSLTQHTGETSTLWEKATIAGRRKASTFRGEEVDINQIMPGAGPLDGAKPRPAAARRLTNWADASLGIVTVVIGREKPFEKWKRWLLEATLPEHTSLTIVDNSACPDFGARLARTAEEFEASGRFRSVRILHGKGPSPDAESRGRLERFQNIAEALTLGLRAVTEMFVMIIDDDTIPTTDAVSRLGGFFVSQLPERPDLAIVSGCYESATCRGRLVAARSRTNWRDLPRVDELRTDEVIEVGYVGNGCCLGLTPAIQRVLPLQARATSDGQLGPDADLCSKLRDAGHSIWLHGGVVCEHLFRVPVTRS